MSSRSLTPSDPKASRGDDALFLQLREATDSVLERYTISDHFDHQGERVVFGQRLMQASSDTFLGWASGPTRDRKRVDFYVRQLNDYKASADITGMTERRLKLYVEVWAEALARAHARSGSASAIGGLPRQGSVVGQSHGCLRAHLRRPEPTGLRDLRRRGRGWEDGGQRGGLSDQCAAQTGEGPG